MTGLEMIEHEIIKKFLFDLFEFLGKIPENPISFEKNPSKFFSKFLEKALKFQEIKNNKYDIFLGSLGEALSENSLDTNLKNFNPAFLSGKIFKLHTLYPWGYNLLIYFFEDTLGYENLNRLGMIDSSRLVSLLSILSFLYNAFSYNILKPQKVIPPKLLQKIRCVGSNLENIPDIRNKILNSKKMKNEFQILESEIKKKLPAFLAKKSLEKDFFLIHEEEPDSFVIVEAIEKAEKDKKKERSDSFLVVVVEDYPFANINWKKEIAKFYEIKKNLIIAPYFKGDHFLFFSFQKGDLIRKGNYNCVPIRLVIVMLSHWSYLFLALLLFEKYYPAHEDFLEMLFEYWIKACYTKYFPYIEKDPKIKKEVIQEIFNTLENINPEKSPLLDSKIRIEIKKSIKTKIKNKEKKQCLACNKNIKNEGGRFCIKCYDKKNYALNFFKILKNLHLLEKFFAGQLTKTELNQIENKLKEIKKFKNRRFKYIKNRALEWLKEYIKFCDKKTEKEILPNKALRWLEKGENFDNSLTEILKSIPEFNKNPLEWKDKIFNWVEQQLNK